MLRVREEQGKGLRIDLMLLNKKIRLRKLKIQNFSTKCRNTILGEHSLPGEGT
jgi:hypothetical protein